MSEIYPFPVLLDSPKTQETAFWRGGVYGDYNYLKRVVEYCEKLPKEQAQIGEGIAEGKELTDMRVSKVAWMKRTDEIKDVYENLVHILKELNRDFFGFEITGFESPQYTVYEGGENGHYDWHVDAQGAAPRPQRKLSLVWQLSDPFEYEGGELWIWGKQKFPVPKERGLVYVFPSTTLHRVTPVTSGIRRSLVAWAVGPQLR